MIERERDRDRRRTELMVVVCSSKAVKVDASALEQHAPA
jgi:hypothetical protein